MGDPAQLLKEWTILSPGWYGCAVIASALAVRLVLAAMAAIQHRSLLAMKHSFVGYPPADLKEGDPLSFCGDYWQAFFVGVLELTAFPVLMRFGLWQFVGAWIGIKVLGNWKAWSEHRWLVNRFLVGMGLVLILSAMWLTSFVYYGNVQ